MYMSTSNELKIRELNFDCIKITTKRNELMKKKKNIIFGIN